MYCWNSESIPNSATNFQHQLQHFNFQNRKIEIKCLGVCSLIGWCDDAFMENICGWHIHLTLWKIFYRTWYVRNLNVVTAARPANNNTRSCNNIKYVSNRSTTRMNLLFIAILFVECDGVTWSIHREYQF